MSTLPRGVEFRPLTIPASVDDPDAADFLDYMRLRNDVLREINGHDDETLTAAELLPHLQPQPDETRLVWVVVDDGRLVGRVGLDIPSHPGSRTAQWFIQLLREVQGRGIGSAALELVETTARERGRSVLQVETLHAAAPGPAIASPTGSGAVPRDHAARFLLARGYALGQVVRNSVLDPVAAADRVDALLAEAAAASPEYRLVTWHAPTPPGFADGYAWLKSRMNTDPPAGALEHDEEVWDAARIAREDAKYLDGGRLLLVTAAQHESSGELVGFTELSIGPDRAGVTTQEDTLVLAAHRGHRLGLRVKCANLVAWRDVAPRSRRVVTWNAEENRPMLDVNEAIGFAPLAYGGGWKKELS